MKFFPYIVTFILLTSCAIFHPQKFENNSLNEKILDINGDTLTLKTILSEAGEKKTFIQVYASYCPFSQDSFEDVLALQKKRNDIHYIFLSVDHSYQDWKRGLDDLKMKGKYYYVPKKGKGALGKFLKLKTIPRFLLLQPEGKINVYKTSKVATIEKKI